MIQTPPDATGARLELWRWMARRNVNQREASDILGINFTMLNHYLHGRRAPALETAVLIERKTGIPVEAWVATDDDLLAQAGPAGRRARR